MILGASITVLRENDFGFVSIDLSARKLAKECEAVLDRLNGFYIGICRKCLVICIEYVREQGPNMINLNRIPIPIFT